MTKWNCPVCRHPRQNEGERCSVCESERVLLSDGFLMRLHGSAADQKSGNADRSFIMTLCHDPQARVLLDEDTRVLPGPRLNFTEEEIDIEVLGEVEFVYEEVTGIDAPPPHLQCTARVVAMGSEVGNLMEGAIRELVGQPEEDEEQDEPEKPPEQIEVVRGENGLQITWIPEVADLIGLRMIPAGFGGLLILMFLSSGGDRGLGYALLLLLPTLLSAYFWLVQLNRRVIRLNSESLSLTFKPLPWPGWQRDRAEVEQLEDHNRTPPNMPSIASYRPDSLCVCFASGGYRWVLKDTNTRQIYYVKEVLSKELGITEESDD